MEDLVHSRALAALRRARVPLFSALLLTSCLAFSQEPDLRKLAADPAGRLRMPGAVELFHFSKDREMTVEGPTSAFDSYLFGTDATPDEVLAFYATELARLGWTRDRLAVNKSSTDIRVDGWCKPADPAAGKPSRSSGLTFRVAIQDPRQVVELDPSGRRYPTVFDAGLIGVDSDQQLCGRGRP